jgi:hypothetical protein
MYVDKIVLNIIVTGKWIILVRWNQQADTIGQTGCCYNAIGISIYYG